MLMTARLVSVPHCHPGLGPAPDPRVGPTITQCIKAVLHFSINIIVQTNSMPKDLLSQTVLKEMIQLF